MRLLLSLLAKHNLRAMDVSCCAGLYVRMQFFCAGKGPSEFYYSWIPFFAPLVGGCAAAGLYAATQLLNHSDVPGTVSWSGSGP